MGRKKVAPEIGGQRKLLPIFAYKYKLLKMVAENQVVIVTGETGSGRTTQIPQYLAEAGYVSQRRHHLCIGCTLPRRIAVESAATRVSEECGCTVGQQVGYEAQFENCSSTNTIIKYMTDGVLVSECAKDWRLKKYSAVIIDEANERTVNTDLLFGMLKNAFRKRPDLRLIVCSATLSSERFSAYFANAPILCVSGYLFPVEITYTNDGITDSKTDHEKIADLLIEIHNTGTAGDVLVFLPGQEDIDTLCAILSNEFSKASTLDVRPVVLPLRSTLGPTQLKEIFEIRRDNRRKIMLDTNIAESSLAIDRIVYVIDSGLLKKKIYQQETDTYMVKTGLISQAQAEQRARRAGCTAAGKCFRLYSISDFNKMPKSVMPEIMHCNITLPVLKLKLWSPRDIFEFRFVDSPPHSVLAAAVYHLMLLGALRIDQTMTNVGWKIANFPVDLEPCLVKLLLLSEQMGCLSEALTLVSLLSVEHKQKLYRSLLARRTKATERCPLFFPLKGDYFTLLEVYEEWRSHKYSNKWCTENSISACDLEEAKKIRQRLVLEMHQQELSRISSSDFVILLKALCAVFFHNAAKRQVIFLDSKMKHGYAKLHGGRFREISLNSSLFETLPVWIVYHEVIQNGRTLLHGVIPIRPEWLVDFAPEFFVKNQNGQISSTYMFSVSKEAAEESPNLEMVTLRSVVNNGSKPAPATTKKKPTAHETGPVFTKRMFPPLGEASVCRVRGPRAIVAPRFFARDKNNFAQTFANNMFGIVRPLYSELVAGRLPSKEKNAGSKATRRKMTTRGKAANGRAMEPPNSKQYSTKNSSRDSMKVATCAVRGRQIRK